MLADAQIHKVGSQLHVSHGDDTKLYVEFSKEAVHQPFDSEQAGRPIYKSVDFITIMFPGDNTKKVVRPVKVRGDESSPSDPQRFPRQWERYERQESQVPDGTPLEHWPPLNKADVLMLKGSGVHTVEALANVSDVNLDSLGIGTRSYREKAKAYLENAKGNEALSKQMAENESLRSDIEALKKQIAEIGKIKKG